MTKRETECVCVLCDAKQTIENDKKNRTEKFANQRKIVAVVVVVVVVADLQVLKQH